jgi:hypothetical protein
MKFFLKALMLLESMIHDNIIFCSQPIIFNRDYGAWIAEAQKWFWGPFIPSLPGKPFNFFPLPQV